MEIFAMIAMEIAKNVLTQQLLIVQNVMQEFTCLMRLNRNVWLLVQITIIMVFFFKAFEGKNNFYLICSPVPKIFNKLYITDTDIMKCI